MNTATPLSELAKVYGKNALVSRINGYNIIHLDDPTEEQIQQRIREMLEGQINNDLDDDRPPRQTMRGHPYDIVYYRL